MSAVSSLASKMGYEVTGCDLEASTAYAKDIFKGHSVAHLKGIDLLVVSPAIFYQNPDNPEFIEGKRLGIVMTWEEFLGKYLTKGKKAICVAGTHGKSTTTAMVGKLLTDAGLDPSVIVGARVSEWGGNCRFGKGEYLVIEADEFNNNFLNYHPDIIILNNIEFDHPDFFKDEKEVHESFNKFIGNLKGEKILIEQKDSYKRKFKLKAFGEHNQENANMVFALGKKLGIKEEIIIKSLESFSGIGRRMEKIADRGGIKVYDDYAHHPTAIAATLKALRDEYPKASILAIDEPHGYKRTKALLQSYKGVFDDADKVIVGPIFQARDEVDVSISPESVVKASNHKDIKSADSLEEIVKELKGDIRKFNIIVVMGAGKSYLWARKIVDFLPLKFSDLTTFRIGGKIGKYIEIGSLNEVLEKIKIAKSYGKPIFIIGGGSDILVSDKDFDGVVVKYTGNNFGIEGDILTAEAGMSWNSLVKYAVGEGLCGIECLSGIPGTVGASPIQNIGAYGQELADTFYELKAFDIEKEKFVTFSKEDCQFGYRESIFKKKEYWQKYLIVSVSLKLKKNAKPEVNYDSLKEVVKKNASLKEIAEAVSSTRKQKLESIKVYGNAGSFFKNPVIGKNIKERLEKDYPEVKIFSFGNDFKVSAAWLIEKSGWKGKEFGNAAVSQKHSLILINKTGKAGAMEIYKLSEMIISSVFDKFGIKLEREVQLINF